MAEPGLEERIAKLEGRVDGFEARFDSLERRFDSLERRMDARFEGIEDTMSKQFRWLLGTQLTVFVTVIAVLAGALFLP